MNDVEATMPDIAVPEDEHSDNVDSARHRPPPPLLQELRQLLRALGSRGVRSEDWCTWVKTSLRAQ